MTPERYQKIKSIYFQAASASEEARPRILEQACGSDVELRKEVENLLSKHEPETAGIASMDADHVKRAIDLIQMGTTPISALGLGSADPPSGRISGISSQTGERAGSVIGPYRLVRPIGEGGFGSVFLAEQEKPVRRQVALKIIKLGMDTRQVVARFEQERQALAMMDHPGIAKVFDAGATESGRPYFVMELSKGEPVSAYCDTNRLSIDERLELLIQVCTAVQHAHNKGIIHRDLKPSNILVSTDDGLPTAKIIDFGIAKATENNLTERTFYTEHHQLIGTPDYMSPEQAEGSQDIDTRTDVYSLGVLLYELLTGDTPFRVKKLRTPSVGDIQRMIRESEPPRPSTRISQQTENIEQIAARRRTEAHRLGQIVHGELDWIVLKAIEKDRQRRYETANFFAADIRRYLADEPVLAAPPSKSYQFSKFVRRNRGSVLAGGAVAAALLAGVIAFAWQARVARHQRDLAVEAQQSEAKQRKIADAERNRAVEAEAETRKRAEELSAVADFQGSMLQQVEPAKAGLHLTADVVGQFEQSLEKSDVPSTQRAEVVQEFRKNWDRINSTDAALSLIDEAILKPAVAAIDKQFSGQPIIRARLQHVLATRYLDLGLNDPALELEGRAFATRRETLGKEHVETLTSMCALGTLLGVLGKHNEAEPLVFEALETRRRLLGSDHPDTIESISAVGNFWGRRNEWAKAEPYCAEAMQSRRRILGDDHPDTLDSIRTYGLAMESVGKLSESEKYMRESADRTRRKYGSDDPRTALAMGHVGKLLFTQGKYAEAEAVFREATEMHRRAFGENHRLTLLSVQNLAQTYLKAGRRDDAEKLAHEVLTIQQRTIGDDHQDTLSTQSNLAVALVDQGKLEEAELLCRDVLQRRLRLFGPDNISTLVSNNIMGYVLRRQGKPAEAEPFLRAALDTARRTLPADHFERLTYTVNMGTLLDGLGRADEAKLFFREVIENGRPSLGQEHPIVIAGVVGLSRVLDREKGFEEQEKLLGEVEPAARKVFIGPKEASLATLLMRRGKARTGMKQFPAAQTDLLEAIAILEKAPASVDLEPCTQALFSLYTSWDENDPKGGHGLKADEWRTKLTSRAATSKPVTTQSQASDSSPSKPNS